jgi:hypothetical protein
MYLYYAILNKVDHPEETKPTFVICGVRDERDKSVAPAQSYDWAGALKGPVRAVVRLTVDGYSKGPFYFSLQPNDPIDVNTQPKCIPFSLPTWRERRKTQIKKIVRQIYGALGACWHAVSWRDNADES